MQMKIRKAIELAQDGYTREEIMEYFHLTEFEYKKQYSEFSKANRKKLKNLLIGNGKRKNVKSAEGSDSPDKMVRISSSIKSGEVIIPDTSYILNRCCRLESLNGTHMLSLIYEQLVSFEKKGNSKIKKLFHMLLDGRVDLTFIKEQYNKEEVPDYEDKADFEILAYAKAILAEGKETPVVYTCDKALALRCKQQGVEYVFFQNESEPNSHYRKPNYNDRYKKIPRQIFYKDTERKKENNIKKDIIKKGGYITA